MAIDEKKLIDQLKVWMKLLNKKSGADNTRYELLEEVIDLIEEQPKLSLETKTSDNRKLIDADDLLKAMEELNHSLQGARYYFAHIENWIRSQPKLDVPDTKVGMMWIPVTSGKLPKQGERIIETFININGKLFVGESTFFLDSVNPQLQMVAWMPLPEPYKGE